MFYKLKKKKSPRVTFFFLADTVVTTVNLNNAPNVHKYDVDNAPVIVTSPKNVQDKITTKINTDDEYSLLLESNINRRVEKSNVIVAPAKNVQMRIVWILNSLNEYNLQIKVNIHKLKYTADFR